MAVAAAASGRWIARPRLSALLDAKPWARLALVSAPAGFGKSTALGLWAASSDVDARTLVLERRDSDVVRFVRSIGVALGCAPEPGSDPVAEGDEPASVETILGWLRLAVEGSAGRRVALVLDDYHLVGEPAVHRIVGSVVDRLPERVVVVIATRADPPLPLSRLRARDELVEVRAADLRFSSEEAAELLRTSGIRLTESDLSELTARTEGWAAVLRLATIALRGRPDASEAVRRFGAGHRFVLDFVVEEVLSDLPAGIVDFLLQTSILERLSGELCDAVTGQDDGQATLERLDRDNLLLLPLDDERRWFRYHGLFADILRGRLRVEAPDRIAVLHDRASRWFEERDLDEEAVDHALAAGDRDRAASLVADASLQRLNSGELGTVRGWLETLGPEEVRRVAQLSLSSAWCLAFAKELDAADAGIADAEGAHAAGRDGGPLSGPMIPAELALIRAFIAGLRGDAVTAIAQASAARELVPPGLPAVAEATLRGDATVFLARAMLVVGDTARGFETYLAALPDLRAGQNVFGIGRAMDDLVGVSIARGDPADGLRLCEEELESTPAMGRSAAYWAAVAKAREAMGEAASAREAAARAFQLAVRAGDGRVVSWAMRTQARLAAPPEVEPPKSPNERLVEPLTHRELEVLRLVADGRSNSAIADELFVTVGTVKSHVHSISGKLGAANRVEAIALARRLGLLD